ncbi:MAG: hypothetical protein PHG27_07455 [Massilibacteroides sp.]|nr:hypothetical protein [Massilibacteroides sp.]MDD3061814.1 hypothetical protein [Massilibacteroides sp.]MDD4115415.1 hypothetical protein [Massilibacteroides sp.]MDD4660096.1 hypothetical protein [Massilibacteroides sp.]
MLLTIFCLMGLPELGVIVWIAVLLFGIKAVSQNPVISRGQKILWMLTILVLNWIGLLWYYYTFYMNDKKK